MIPLRYEFVQAEQPVPASRRPAASDRAAHVKVCASGKRFQTLMGVTGSGKTFTMANVIAEFDRPVLVVSHNKTLAAQLYEEFKELFPRTPWSTSSATTTTTSPRPISPSGTSTSRRTPRATRTSTACGSRRRPACRAGATASSSPRPSRASSAWARRKTTRPAWWRSAPAIRCDRNTILGRLADIRYDPQRHRLSKRGTFRVRGDVVEIQPSYESFGIRIEFFGDEIEQISYINPVSGQTAGDREPGLHLPGPALRDAGRQDRQCRRGHPGRTRTAAQST